MSLTRQIVVRYRAEGHVRFSLPSALRQPQPARQLEEALQKVQGVYRVGLSVRQGKLSIRYTEGVADITSVARALRDIVSRIEIPPAESPGSVRNGLIRRETRAGLWDWLKGNYRRAEETLSALRLAPHKGPVMTPEREQFAVDFLTDILVLYLVKRHWNMIYHAWLRRPWQYRYDWLATFYLIFLLVRSRKPK